MADAINLITLFGSVVNTLQENKTELNKADTYNGDHGDNMVEIFSTITDALSEKEGADPADQLAYASELLGQKKSGSAQLYSQGLTEAASQFSGQQITQENAMTLIQTLLGAGESSSSAGSIEGLLGGLLGGGEDDDAGFDASDLLNAGLAFLSAKNKGESTSEALIDAVVSASPLSETEHRAQSSKLVAGTLLDVLSGLTGQ